MPEAVFYRHAQDGDDGDYHGKHAEKPGREHTREDYRYGERDELRPGPLEKPPDDIRYYLLFRRHAPLLLQRSFVFEPV